MRNVTKDRLRTSVSALGLMAILLSVPFFFACSPKTALPAPDTGAALQQTAEPEKPAEPEKSAEPAQTMDDDIPELPLTGSYTLTSGTAYGVATKFPDTWELTDPVDGMQNFVIKRKDSGTENADNVNIIVSEKIGRDLMKSDLPDFKAMYKENLSMYGLDASNMRIVSINGIPAFYYDYYTQLTDEAIDLMVENGIMSQEAVNFLGKDTVKDMLQSYQVVGIASIDGTLIIVTGTYTDEEDKSEIVDIVNLLISNAEIIS